MSYRSKILGMLVGGAIGDALGMPVESWTPRMIRKAHDGQILHYVEPVNHKYFTGDPSDESRTYMPAGSTTDDTQLTLATCKGVIEGEKRYNQDQDQNYDHYLDAIAEAHVEAMKNSVTGWGRTTLEAVERLASGVHWSESGKSDNPSRGTGNGVPMKCSPLAALWFSKHFLRLECGEEVDKKIKRQLFVDFSAMTHYTKMSAEATLMHIEVLCDLLSAKGRIYPVERAMYRMKSSLIDYPHSPDWSKFSTCHLMETKDDIISRMEKMFKFYSDGELSFMNIYDLRDEFGNGSCYLYDSFPFAYSIFARKPFSFDAVLDAVNAGGDTDTNAKLVGELLGALHGLEFFEDLYNSRPITGLLCYEEILSIGNQLCDVLEIE